MREVLRWGVVERYLEAHVEPVLYDLANGWRRHM